MKVGRIKLKEYRGIELTHPEMRFLVGGSTGSGSRCTRYECQCDCILGTWTGCYKTEEAINNAIDNYCDGSGFCKKSE